MFCQCEYKVNTVYVEVLALKKMFTEPFSIIWGKFIEFCRISPSKEKKKINSRN